MPSGQKADAKTIFIQPSDCNGYGSDKTNENRDRSVRQLPWYDPFTGQIAVALTLGHC